MLVRVLTTVLLLVVGMANFVAGLLALFPGLFQAGLTQGVNSGGGGPASVGLLDLLSTQYGALSVLLLGTAFLQFAAASWLHRLLASGPPLSYLVLLIALLSGAVEMWGWFFKSSLSLFNMLGLLLAVLLSWLGIKHAG